MFKMFKIFFILYFYIYNYNKKVNIIIIQLVNNNNLVTLVKKRYKFIESLKKIKINLTKINIKI